MPFPIDLAVLGQRPESHTVILYDQYQAKWEGPWGKHAVYITENKSKEINAKDKNRRDKGAF